MRWVKTNATDILIGRVMTHTPLQTAAPPHDAIMPALIRGSVWVIVQLAPLFLLLLHAPMWARSPQPVEHFAPITLLTTQLLASAMLFPWLLDRRGSIVFVVGSAALFQLLATIAAEQPLTLWMIRSLISVVWLLGLAIVSRLNLRPLWVTLFSAILSIIAPLAALLAPL